MTIISLPTRLNKLADEAEKFGDGVDWPVGEIANTLLKQAKTESDDPVLANIQLLEPRAGQKVSGHTGVALRSSCDRPQIAYQSQSQSPCSTEQWTSSRAKPSHV